MSDRARWLRIAYGMWQEAPWYDGWPDLQASLRASAGRFVAKAIGR